MSKVHVVRQGGIAYVMLDQIILEEIWLARGRCETIKEEQERHLAHSVDRARKLHEPVSRKQDPL